MRPVNLDKIKAARSAEPRRQSYQQKASASKKTTANRAFVPRFISSCRGLLEDVNALPDRAEDFAGSLRIKIKGMIAWAEKNDHVTDSMRAALVGMRKGVEKWQKPR